MLKLNEDEVKVLRRVMTLADGRRGEFLYDLYQACNEIFFDGSLPTPLITTEILPYGRCRGLTHASPVPHIRIAEVILGPDGRVSSTNPDLEQGGSWTRGIPRPGKSQIYWTFIHEMVHVAQQLDHLRSGVGETSHNAPSWVSECNRLSESLDLPRCCRRWVSRRSRGEKSARVPDLKEPTADTVVEDLTMGAVATWPHGVARIVHKDFEGWSESMIRKHNLPRF